MGADVPASKKITMIGGWFLFISIGLGLVGVVISSITERFQSAKVLEFLSDEDSIAEDVSTSCMLRVVLVTLPLLKLHVLTKCTCPVEFAWNGALQYMEMCDAGGRGQQRRWKPR